MQNLDVEENEKSFDLDLNNSEMQELKYENQKVRMTVVTWEGQGGMRKYLKFNVKSVFNNNAISLSFFHDWINLQMTI